MQRKGPVRHQFVDSGERDGQRRQICEWCWLPDANAVHDIPQRSDEERDDEARRVGERDA